MATMRLQKPTSLALKETGSSQRPWLQETHERVRACLSVNDGVNVPWSLRLR